MHTLFMVVAGMDHEPEWLRFTALTFEGAVEQAEHQRSECCNFDTISIKAIQPGPGQAVTVARWISEWPTIDSLPCDGDGPPLEIEVSEPEPQKPTWKRVL
jgi:hypothetical protein